MTCEGTNRGKTRLPETQHCKPDNCVKGLGRSEQQSHKHTLRIHCFPIIFTPKTTRVEIFAEKLFFHLDTKRKCWLWTFEDVELKSAAHFFQQLCFWKFSIVLQRHFRKWASSMPQSKQSSEINHNIITFDLKQLVFEKSGKNNNGK